MKKFGIVKTKILNKLIEYYSNENKEEIKNVLGLIKENKDFKEMYVFYEEIENKYIENKEEAQLYVETLEDILKAKSANLEQFSFRINKAMNQEDIYESEVYEALDALTEDDTLSNIESKVKSKTKLVEHLTTKKESNQTNEGVVVPNESLLQAVLTNNFNVLYSNTLSESQKEELKNILAIPYDELSSKTTELKESIINQVGTILSESNDVDLTTKLNKVKDEVQSMKLSRYNYYRLTELKNGLN
jgi:hypothetical protein